MAEDLKSALEQINRWTLIASNMIMPTEDYIAMISEERKQEMIDLWGELPPAIQLKDGEIIPLWE